MTTPILPAQSLWAGVRYFFKGLKWLWHPQLRGLALMPILINTLVFIGLTWCMVTYFDAFNLFTFDVPPFLKVLEKTLKWITWIFLGAMILILYAYTFNVMTNVFAAPFYGLLAQRTQEIFTGQTVSQEPLAHLIARTCWRELRKFLYFISRGLLIFLVLVLMGLTPILNFGVPMLGALWGAWTMAIQYVDYAADNQQTPFIQLRQRLRKRCYTSLGFGGTVLGISMFPVINIFAAPAAVVGGTLFWLQESQTPANV